MYWWGGEGDTKRNMELVSTSIEPFPLVSFLDSSGNTSKR